MSEFSESYHIRANDLAPISRKFVEAQLPGLAFPPINGWIAYVPFAEGKAYRRIAGEGNGAFAAALSRIAGADVIQFVYAEDHLWAFTICRNGVALGAYMCAWDPEFSISNNVDAALLQPYCASVKAVDEWRELLEPASYQAVIDGGLPQRFAAEIGLGKVAWLSPHYAQKDLEHFVGEGAFVIGDRPASPDEKIKKPKLRRLVLPPLPTAREAFNAVTSAMANWDATYIAISLRAARARNGGDLPLPVGLDGRAAYHGAWEMSFQSSERGAFAHVRVSASGDIDEIKVGRLMRARRLDGTVINTPALSSHWLDSPEILEIAARHPLVTHNDQYPMLYAISAKLGAWQEETVVWRVQFFFRSPDDKASPQVSVELVLDPQTGAISSQRRTRYSQGRVEDWP